MTPGTIIVCWTIAVISSFNPIQTLSCNKEYTYFENYSQNGFNVTCNGITAGYEHVLDTITVYGEISLTIVDSFLENITPSSFKRMKNIKTLSIVNSRLPFDRELELFSCLTRLETLQIRNTEFYITNSTLRQLKTLKNLEFSNNSMETVERSSFRELSALEKLFITDNRVSDLQALDLCRLKALKVLNVHGNKLQTVEGLDCIRDSLAVLDLSSNLIAGVDGAIQNLTAVKYINLGDNNLSDIEYISSQTLSELESLILKNNFISQVNDRATSNWQSLLVLDLSFNDLNHFVAMNNSNLEILNLEHNDLRSFRFEFLPRMKTLNLGSNKLSTLTVSLLNGVPNLEELILKDNSVSRLSDEMFFGLTKLRWLDLSLNNLTSISDNSFRGLASLEVLNMSSNALLSLSYIVLEPLRNLDILDVSNNKITHFQYEEIIISSLSALYIKNNPLTCDVVSEIVKYLKTENVSFTVNANPDYGRENIEGIPCSGAQIPDQARLSNVGIGVLITVVIFIVSVCVCRSYVRMKRKRCRLEEIELIN
ncbi:leucine-rich repeat-containing G-protein coupled receptor 4-like [Cylas formicarius]|uniref:leucine-rich repeat-containing G-protein coupled receptor 4-like n=1 Tax=Cylas formicarius TaxID=197179 RepID=UPI0029586B78|nr:leucine-rich repeat-containing G-protein coupled receptor 4-like [Cylas formicarius]